LFDIVLGAAIGVASRACWEIFYGENPKVNAKHTYAAKKLK
jgi:hypothetical protein